MIFRLDKLCWWVFHGKIAFSQEAIRRRKKRNQRPHLSSLHIDCQHATHRAIFKGETNSISFVVEGSFRRIFRLISKSVMRKWLCWKWKKIAQHTRNCTSRKQLRYVVNLKINVTIVMKWFGEHWKTNQHKSDCEDELECRLRQCQRICKYAEVQHGKSNKNLSNFQHQYRGFHGL